MVHYDLGGDWEVYYTSDPTTANMPSEFLGAYSTREKAEKAADKASERVAYGNIDIYNRVTKKHYEYWPTKGRLKA